MGENNEEEDESPIPSSSEPSTSQPVVNTAPDSSNALEHTQPSSQQRRAPVSASLARDCRMETRLLDGSARGRQDMTIMLAAPGMPLHKSPFITTRQATSLLSALCEPLVQVSVGRLTRRLESPTHLRPTQDRGVISLWLLPNDDLSLVWQGRATDVAQTGPTSSPPGQSAAAVPVISPTSGSGDNATPPSAPATPPSALSVQDVERTGCEVTVWEELARFSSGMHPGSNISVITIHMLRGDSSGRAFYIRPRGDATATHAQAAAAAGGILPTDAVSNSKFDSSSEEGRRMYFWLTGNDLASAVRNLGRLKSRKFTHGICFYVGIQFGVYPGCSKKSFS